MRRFLFISGVVLFGFQSYAGQKDVADCKLGADEFVATYDSTSKKVTVEYIENGKSSVQNGVSYQLLSREEILAHGDLVDFARQSGIEPEQIGSASSFVIEQDPQANVSLLKFNDKSGAKLKTFAMGMAFVPIACQ